MSERILLLSYAFPPVASPEAFVAAKVMGDLPGIETDVITVGPKENNQPPDHSLDAYVGERFGKITRISAPGWLVQVLRNPLLWNLFPGLFHRPDFCVYYNKLLLAELRDQDLSEYRAIVTRSQWHSVHLVGLALKKANPSLRWTAHFSDPWVDNPYVKYGKREMKINRRMEEEVLTAADAIVFTSEPTADLVLRKYPIGIRDKAVVVPHPFDPVLYPRPDEGVTKAGPRDLGSEPLIFRYLGYFYGKRSPVPLFEALAEIAARRPEVLQNVRFELIGARGAALAGSPAYQALPTGLVELRPMVDYVTSLRLMTEADALLVIDAPDDLSVFLPSKLIDYLGAGRPVIGLTPPGEATRVISETGGYSADVRDKAEIARTLEQVIVELKASPHEGGEARPRVEAAGQRISVFHIAAIRDRMSRIILGKKGAGPG